MDAEQQRPSRRMWIRPAAFVALVGLSGLVLPVSAYAVEAVSSRAENWIIVVYLVSMAALGVLVGAGVRRVAAASLSSGWAAMMWAGVGVLAAAVGAAIWLVSIAG